MIWTYNLRLVGVWRSLVAHLHGVQGVEGSNPFTPTIYSIRDTGYNSDVVARFLFLQPWLRRQVPGHEESAHGQALPYDAFFS